MEIQIVSEPSQTDAFPSHDRSLPLMTKDNLCGVSPRLEMIQLAIPTDCFCGERSGMLYRLSFL
jgi:hypothetical protein